MSRPATFLTTIPPDFTSLPSRVAERHADHQVGAVPYSRRRGPLQLAEITPPTVAPSAKGGSRRHHLAIFPPADGELAPAQSGANADGEIARFVLQDAAQRHRGQRHIGGHHRPGQRRLVEFPASAMVRPAAAASRSASASSAGLVAPARLSSNLIGQPYRATQTTWSKTVSRTASTRPPSRAFRNPLDPEARRENGCQFQRRWPSRPSGTDPG